MSRWLVAAALLACPASAADLDQKALLRHIHKTFNTPPDLKLDIKQVQPSSVPGFLSGRLELGDGSSKQEQDVLVSSDGHYYILSPAYSLGPSPVPGLKAPVTRPDAPPPPPASVTQDGKHMVFGNPVDLTVDPDADNLKKLRADSSPAMGPASAPVTIVEFSDLQCPHCKRAHETMDAVTKDYPGKIRRVFKHFPLQMHPWARDAALAAACAAAQKPAASFQLEADFFREQETLEKPSLSAKMAEFAKKDGIDPAALGRCVDSGQSRAKVEADIAEGSALGVNGTPAIFINGRRLRGYDAHEIRATIDEMLSSKR
jgi:protein-disulfide isomerase